MPRVIGVSVRPGRDHVHPDAPWRELERQAAGDGVHAGLGGDVGQEPDAGTQRSGRTGRQQEPACRPEVRYGRPEGEQDAGQVDGQDPVPVAEIEIG